MAAVDIACRRAYDRLIRGGIAAGGLVVATIAALGLALAATATAGGPIVPTPGDVQLGKAGGIRYVADTSRTTTDPDAISYTGCPNPGNQWRLTGGGVRAGAGITAITGSQPQDLYSSLGDADLDRDDYWRTEVESSGAGTRYTGYAICAKLKALSYPEIQVPQGLVAPTTVTDPCPGRTEPTGGGGWVSSLNSVPIISMFPDGAGWTLILTGSLDTNSFAYNTYICSSPKGFKTVTKATRIKSLGSKSVEARCPRKRHVVGGGIEVASPSAAVAFASFPIDAGDKDKVPDDGWRVGAQSKTTQQQTLRAYAICKG